MTNEMVVKNNSSLMPSLTMDEAAYRYNMVVEYTKKMMKAGKDYGSIPGTKTKPTLLKPGAEKLCTLFGMVPRFEILDKITDFESGLFYFQYLCKLEKDGRLIGTGIGSCNSKEKKYRWRYVMEWDATDADKDNAVEVIKFKARNGKKYTKYKFENSEPFELVNTIDKMAQKRSLVAATLIATNASEFFTQDIEDLDIIEGDFTHIEPEQPDPVEDALKDAGPEDIMTIEKACAVTNSEGTPYGELDNEKLSAMTIGIGKALNKNGLTDDKRNQYLEKQSAIKVILQARNDGSLAS
jgi:hypothetical protein